MRLIIRDQLASAIIRISLPVATGSTATVSPLAAHVAAMAPAPIPGRPPPSRRQPANGQGDAEKSPLMPQPNQSIPNSVDARRMAKRRCARAFGSKPKPCRRSHRSMPSTPICSANRRRKVVTPAGAHYSQDDGPTQPGISLRPRMLSRLATKRASWS